MNKKGQTLIIFVLLIPIIILLLAVIVDVGLLKYHQLKTRSLIDDGILMVLDQNQEMDKIKELLKLNDIPTENLMIVNQENQFVVSISYKIDSLFGKIIQMNEYEIVVQREGFIENGKVIIVNKE